MRNFLQNESNPCPNVRECLLDSVFPHHNHAVSNPLKLHFSALFGAKMGSILMDYSFSNNKCFFCFFICFVSSLVIKWFITILTPTDSVSKKWFKQHVLHFAPFSIVLKNCICSHFALTKIRLSWNLGKRGDKFADNNASHQSWIAQINLQIGVCHSRTYMRAL